MDSWTENSCGENIYGEWELITDVEVSPLSYSSWEEGYDYEEAMKESLEEKNEK